MTFDEAMTVARTGGFIRHPDMGKGWTIGSIIGIKNHLWCFNPHTGSEYAYTAKPMDKARTDWYVSKTKIAT